MFVEIPIVTSETELADLAAERLMLRWPDWDPHYADMEVVLIEELAPMAADVAQAAAKMPSAAFRQFGQSFHGVMYDEGTMASGMVRFRSIAPIETFDPDDRTIPAGSMVNIDGYAFTTDEATTIAEGEVLSDEVGVTAALVGASFNGLVGNVVQPLTEIGPWLLSIELTLKPAGGSDPETDEEYQERLSDEMELLSRSLVSRRDYEYVARRDPEIAAALAQHNGSRQVRITATDSAGEPVSANAKNRVLAVMTPMLLINVDVSFVDPTYTTVSISLSYKLYEGQREEEADPRIRQALLRMLDPSNSSQQPDLGQWRFDPKLRIGKVMQVVSALDGLDYVDPDSVLLNGINDDLELNGAVPLTRAGTITLTPLP